jgi:hypothetical protein
MMSTFLEMNDDSYRLKQSKSCFTRSRLAPFYSAEADYFYSTLDTMS